MHEWQIHVTGVGCIGTVHERNETLARCAALSRYGEDVPRSNPDAGMTTPICEDDEFSVAKI